MSGAGSWARLRVGRTTGLPVPDVVLSLALLVVAVASAAADRPEEGPDWLTVPVAVAMSVAVAWRSRAALVSLLVIVAAGQVQTLLGEEPGSLWALGILLLAAYSVAANCSEGRAAVGGAVLVGVQWWQEWQVGGEDYLFVVIVFGGAWLLGRLVRQWRSRATAAELNQDERARLAVAEERARIARELHDVVAHGVSVIAIQADAAEAVLGIDPERAREPLTVIRSSARDVLDEMRRLLVLLRVDGDAGDGVSPQPGLDQLPDLVNAVAAAGLPVDLDVDGDGSRPPAGVDLSAYRIVQEALTNVLRHAGCAPTTVVVRSRVDAVTVEVSNAAGGPAPAAVLGGGHGLAGIRERVALASGDVEAGPLPGGGFRVRAVLPVVAPSRVLP